MPRKSVFDMSFAQVYQALVAKAERKARTRTALDRRDHAFDLLGREHDEPTAHAGSYSTDFSDSTMFTRLSLKRIVKATTAENTMVITNDST